MSPFVHDKYHLDLEWKVIYVSSAENASLDQTLDEILVGPVPVGVNKFVFEVDAPDVTIIPEKDILGVTVSIPVLKIFLNIYIQSIFSFTALLNDVVR